MCRVSVQFSAVLLFASFAIISNATAQRVDWGTKGARALSQPLSRLPLQDQRGVATALKTGPSGLAASRVDVGGGHIFLVQGLGVEEGGCSPTGNCDFWVLSSDYKILLHGLAQMSKLKPTMHHGMPDIVTSMHGSAFESGLNYWQFQGVRYVRIACADAVYGDNHGNVFKKPRIFISPCVAGD